MWSPLGPGMSRMRNVSSGDAHTVDSLVTILHMPMMNKLEQDFRLDPGVTLRYFWVSWLEGEAADVLVTLQLEVFDFIGFMTFYRIYLCHLLKTAFISIRRKWILTN